MTQSEYEQNRHDCWIRFKTESMFTLDEEAFKSAFDRAYALGKQEKGADAVIQGWVARDKDEELYVHKTKSYRGAGNHGKPEFGVAEAIIKLSKDSFPDLTWSDDPEPVEIIIKRKKND